MSSSLANPRRTRIDTWPAPHQVDQETDGAEASNDTPRRSSEDHPADS